MQHNNQELVQKRVLKNGLTVLVRSARQIPKVSTQLWYNVGSKDEEVGQKGIAHLIEHMIFKGTDKLAETDITMITNRLAGYCNAFTSYDYTGYLFDFPSNNWQLCLPIMADCMINCTFRTELLVSELKAVIQELKMYKDNYSSTLIEQMISAIFPDHPYHFPIIGYKHDLWDLSREALVAFYKKHYIPNNATLVVVGDVDPEEVFKLAQDNFGHLEPNWDYQKKTFYHEEDIGSTGVTLYRDIAQPMLALAFVLPGSREKWDYSFDVLSWLLGEGKSSRLYQRLVDELQLANDVEAFAYDLFDYSAYFIYIQPRRENEIDHIIDIVKREIEDLANGFSAQELERGIKQCQSDFYDLLENTQKQAYFIGQSYIAHGDHNYMGNYFDKSPEDLKKSILYLLKNYFSPSRMHVGKILELPDADVPAWQELQQRIDQEDQRVLSLKQRTVAIEPGKMIETIQAPEIGSFDFPKPQRAELSNGLKVLYFDNPNVAKIDLLIDLKAKHYYEPRELAGIGAFVSSMMLEGTKNYTGPELSMAIEERGMSIFLAPGIVRMSVLKDDFGVGLELLHEVLMHATFEPDAIEKVRQQLIAALRDYWDEPTSFVTQMARDAVYKDHPYSKAIDGTFESLERITRADLMSHYQQTITPYGASISIVGDLNGYLVPELLESTLGKWHGRVVEDIAFPGIAPTVPSKILSFMNRDQVVLCYAGLSVSRHDPDYDKLLIFDQIFTGGSGGSMNSRLFSVREATGLFYTIGGSLLAGSDDQPGMIMIKTIVSLDSLDASQAAIEKVINEAVDSISDAELLEAKNALAYSLVEYFEANRSIASTFAFIERFNLPDDFFDTRAAVLAKIEKHEIQAAVRRHLCLQKLVKIVIGRVDTKR